MNCSCGHYSTVTINFPCGYGTNLTAPKVLYAFWSVKKSTFKSQDKWLMNIPPWNRKSSMEITSKWIREDTCVCDPISTGISKSVVIRGSFFTVEFGLRFIKPNSHQNYLHEWPGKSNFNYLSTDYLLKRISTECTITINVRHEE